MMTLVAKENPSVYVMGCPCHISHNTAVKAADVFESVEESESAGVHYRHDVLWNHMSKIHHPDQALCFE